MRSHVTRSGRPSKPGIPVGRPARIGTTTPSTNVSATMKFALDDAGSMTWPVKLCLFEIATRVYSNVPLAHENVTGSERLLLGSVCAVEAAPTEARRHTAAAATS